MNVLALWVMIAGAVVVGYVAGMDSTVEIMLLVLWVVVVWLAWEVEGLRNASTKSLRDKYAKVIKAIDEGLPVEPKHDTPAKPGGSRGDPQQMFYDFVAFADEVNKRLDWDGWRLQEEATGSRVRDYAILYHGQKVGRLGLDLWETPYRRCDTEVMAEVELWYARLFDLDSIHSFLRVPISLICADTHENWDRADADMESRLTHYLWDAVKVPEGMPRFTMLIKGRPLAYFDQGEAREETRKYFAEMERKLGPSPAE